MTGTDCRKLAKEFDVQPAGIQGELEHFQEHPPENPRDDATAAKQEAECDGKGDAVQYMKANAEGEDQRLRGSCTNNQFAKRVAQRERIVGRGVKLGQEEFHSVVGGCRQNTRQGANACDLENIAPPLRWQAQQTDDDGQYEQTSGYHQPIREGEARQNVTTRATPLNNAPRPRILGSNFARRFQRFPRVCFAFAIMVFLAVSSHTICWSSVIRMVISHCDITQVA